ncbi:MAG: Inner membrane protein YijD [Candidatus Erwinia impunctatus]|nr:Inner membrane protein YijD [Culicoides impunctatus]
MLIIPNRDKGTLLLAFIAGLSINGCFSVLFNSLVPFSVFPLISLGLAAAALHHRYLNSAMSSGMPSLAAAFALLGVLLYSAVIKVTYPQMGSNFIPTLLTTALFFWIVLRLRSLKQKQMMKTSASD